MIEPDLAEDLDDAVVVLVGVEGEVAPEQLLETRGNAKTSSFVAIISAMMLAGKSSSGSADRFTTTRLSCSQSRHLTHRLYRMLVAAGVCASAGVLPFSPPLGFMCSRRSHAMAVVDVRRRWYEVSTGKSSCDEDTVPAQNKKTNTQHSIITQEKKEEKTTQKQTARLN